MAVETNVDPIDLALSQWELKLDTTFAPSTPPLEVAAQTSNEQVSQTEVVEPASGPYEDQIIGGEESEDSEYYESLDRDTSDDTHGRRLLSIEYNLFHEDSVRTRTEHGVVLRLSQETLQHGTFSVDARAKYDSVGGDPDNQVGEFFGLRQDGFALNENWLMDNAFGDQVARSNRLVGQSYRRSLGSTLLRGVSTRLYSSDTEFSFTIGKTGDSIGTGTRVFSEDDATLAGLGFTRSFGDYWTGGFQSWVLRDDKTVSDHQSVAGAIEYYDPVTKTLGQLHTLVDSTGNLGVWADADHFLGRWRHRYGLFRLEPGLLWSDARIASDTQGIYWRADKRGFRRTWGAGVDLQESNIESAPARAGVVLMNSFASLTWRLTRRLSAGGIANLGLQRPGRGRSTESIDSYGLTAFLANEFDFGQSRFQTSYDTADGDTVDDQTYLLSWDHNWALPRGHNLGTTIEHEYTDEPNDQIHQSDIGVSYRLALTSDVALSTDFQLTRASGETSGKVETADFDLGVIWRPARDWQIDLSAVWNRSETSPRLGNDATSIDRRVFLTLRRVHSSGRAPVTYGYKSDKSGTGTVTGRVFFDDNRDGRWSVTEEVASGVLVFLDGRYNRSTDENGQFTFAPVFVGEHIVVLSLDDIPLPFGLDDESARRVRVGVRKTTTINFPLIRLDQ